MGLQDGLLLRTQPMTIFRSLGYMDLGCILWFGGRDMGYSGSVHSDAR